MQKSPALAELKSRAVLRISGKDSVPFLQNLISQDMAGAVSGSPVFSALLTPQGKYLYDFFVLPSGTSFLLDVEAERAKELVALLARYRLRGEVTFEDLSTHAVFAAWNGEAADPDSFIDPRLAQLGQRIIAPRETAPQTNADESAYREHRYALGVAEGSHEILAGYATLLEINFDALNGVNFEKGCYMGQELTARTHYRALIKRRYMSFRFEGAAPGKTAHITHDGVELGEVHAVGISHGIGLFHIENTKPHLGKKIAQDGTTFEITLPYYLEQFIR